MVLNRYRGSDSLLESLYPGLLDYSNRNKYSMVPLFVGTLNALGIFIVRSLENQEYQRAALVIKNQQPRLPILQ